LNVWIASNGQQIGWQIGTMKTGSQFEDNKLKTVDHGFAYLGVYSQNRRIIVTESTFYSGDERTKTELDQKKILKCVLEKLN